jgi:predicted Zn-dependent peptidase
MILGVVAGLFLSQAQPEVVTLGNGMRWVLVPRDEKGWVAGAVVVAAGSIDEREGETGAAHLLEHLAFKGTPIIGSVGWASERPFMEEVNALLDERAKLKSLPADAPAVLSLETRLVRAEVEWENRTSPEAWWIEASKHALRSNANTTKDRTAYHADFSSEKLEVWLSMEAQRFAAPVFRDLRTERKVVIQELLDQRSEATRAEDLMCELAFSGSGYAWPTIGREADLAFMSPSTLDAFYEAHYTPGNSVGVLVGSFDPAQAKALLKKTFAHVPARPHVPRSTVRFRDPARGHLELRERQLLIGFSRPGPSWSTSAAWDVLEHLLGAPGGPLEAIIDEELATSAWVSDTPGTEAEHLAVMRILPRRETRFVDLEKRLFEVLAAWTPSEADLEGARTALDRGRRSLVRDRRSFATHLGESLLFSGNTDASEAERIAAVKLDDVMRLVRTLTPERAWVVTGGAP